MSTATSSRGYTLLELIVAVGIFSLIMLAVSSAYLSLIRLDRETRAVNDIINNLSFAVDSMGREMRTGRNYDCNPSTAGVQSCPTSPSSSFTFTDSSNRTVTYTLSGGQVFANIAGTQSAITDPRIVITNMAFYVRGATAGDTTQPQVILSMKGTITLGPSRTVEASVQVAATQRLLDL